MCQIPCSQCSRSDCDILRPGDGASEIVGKIHSSLDGLAELDYDHVTEGVAILERLAKVSLKTLYKMRKIKTLYKNKRLYTFRVLVKQTHVIDTILYIRETVNQTLL